MVFSPVIPLYLAEFCFGLVYAMLIHWLAVNKYMQGSTAWSVIVGDSGTILIAYAFLQTDIPIHVLILSFACSGLPMTVSYFYRTEQRRTSHKARPIGNRVRKIRDEVVMDLTLVCRDIANGEKPASVVDRIHHSINYLKVM